MAIYDEEGHYMGEGDEGDFDLGEGLDIDPMSFAMLAGMGGLGGMFGGEELVSFDEEDDVEPESWVHEDKPAPEGVSFASNSCEAAAMDFS